MSLTHLLEGVAVVIDDEVSNPDANIGALLRQLEGRHFPILKYTTLPSVDEISHYQCLAFVLLDWRLTKQEIGEEETEAGVNIPATLQEVGSEANIRFLKSLEQHCFCPVFVFTNENPDEIAAYLANQGLLDSDRPNHIFIKSKQEVAPDEQMFLLVESWLRSNPSMYVLKEWDREYQRSKNSLFQEFQRMSPVWPQIVWETVKDDKGNKSYELGELISRNLHTRMEPFEFNEQILSTAGEEPDQTELRRVLEGGKFITDLHREPMTGDLYVETITVEKDGKEEEKSVYWLNIRPQCDLMRNQNPCLYCILGEELEQKANGKIKDVSFNRGEYLEKARHAIVPFIDGGKIIEFQFTDLQLRTVSTLKRRGIRRIGRLLPPYITQIQQRFALYIQRQDLPRIPNQAIFPQK